MVPLEVVLLKVVPLEVVLLKVQFSSTNLKSVSTLASFIILDTTKALPHLKVTWNQLPLPFYVFIL